MSINYISAQPLERHTHLINYTLLLTFLLYNKLKFYNYLIKNIVYLPYNIFDILFYKIQQGCNIRIKIHIQY